MTETKTKPESGSVNALAEKNEKLRLALAEARMLIIGHHKSPMVRSGTLCPVCETADGNAVLNKIANALDNPPARPDAPYPAPPVAAPAASCGVLHDEPFRSSYPSGHAEPADAPASINVWREANGVFETPAAETSDQLAQSRPTVTVAGRMEMSHAQFQQACETVLDELQREVNPNNAVVRLLCEALRCSRENIELAKTALLIPTDAPASPGVRAALEAIIASADAAVPAHGYSKFTEELRNLWTAVDAGRAALAAERPAGPGVRDALVNLVSVIGHGVALDNAMAEGRKALADEQLSS